MTAKPSVPIESQILLRVDEVSALLSVNRDAVYTLARLGILPTVTLNGLRRFPRRGLDELAANYDAVPRCGRCAAEMARIDDMVKRPVLLTGKGRTG